MTAHNSTRDNKQVTNNTDYKQFFVATLIKLAPIFIALFVIYIASLSNALHFTKNEANITCDAIFVSLHK